MNFLLNSERHNVPYLFKGSNLVPFAATTKQIIVNHGLTTTPRTMNVLYWSKVVSVEIVEWDQHQAVLYLSDTPVNLRLGFQ